MESTPLVSFEQERGRLFGIAYRMLGSVSEAEDVVQDAYLRWHGVDHGQVENPQAYLVRLVTNLAMDTLGAARYRRTEYIGPWLPEPLIGAPQAADPASRLDVAEDLSMAFLLVLERLTPVERAVFVLHESLDFSYAEIATIIGKSTENCRQIARRARQHLAAEHYAAPADPATHEQILTRFLIATETGDLQGLLELLASDAVMYSDGGGKVTAARQPLLGAERVARFLVGIAGKAMDLEYRPALINGRFGVLILLHGQAYGVLSAHIVDGQVRAVYLVANPDKLPQSTGL
jgi:RNA polymerase sigma-70 factor (ECF subfamily)